MPDKQKNRQPDADQDVNHEDQKLLTRKKENNPFSEEDKHGPDAHRRSPGNAEEYQGDPSVQRRAPGVEDDNSEPRDQERE
jgi:hypothetical protein